MASTNYLGAEICEHNTWMNEMRSIRDKQRADSDRLMASIQELFRLVQSRLIVPSTAPPALPAAPPVAQPASVQAAAPPVLPAAPPAPPAAQPAPLKAQPAALPAPAPPAAPPARLAAPAKPAPSAALPAPAPVSAPLPPAAWHPYMKMLQAEDIGYFNPGLQAWEKEYGKEKWAALLPCCQE